MTQIAKGADASSIAEAALQLREAASAKKCWPCGCMHSTLDAIDTAADAEPLPSELGEAVRAGRERLAPIRYDCLGCEVCWPAVAVNALGLAGETCATQPVQAREGWPPLPGSYVALRYHAPVAICTLTDEAMMRRLAEAFDPAVAIVGTLQTENLGIERLIENTAANPNIRFLIICGEDSRKAVGHLPGQTLLALAGNGVDADGRVRGSKGKRPVLRNVPADAVEHFRKAVEVADFVGCDSVENVLGAARELARRRPGPCEAPPFSRRVEIIAGHLPPRMIPDPAGYFVVHPDPRRQLLQLEHYRNEGLLDGIVEGRDAAECYVPVMEKGWISRLDHAAYLGRELARAEMALASGENYIQDGAPEHPGAIPNQEGCGCGAACGGEIA